MSFDLVVIGCGGGPLESNLSSYFFKASHLSWEKGILAIEAGSGLGALRDVLAANPLLFEGPDGDSSRPSGSTLVGGNGSPTYRASWIYSYVRTFLISHAHFDHISGLVIGAGSTLSPEMRSVAGLPSVMRDLQSIFDGEKLWPRLVRQRNEIPLSCAYVYLPIQPLSAYRILAPSLSAHLVPIAHGSIANGTAVYDSTAFFVRNEDTNREFLFFGDVEPDSVSSPRDNGHGRNRAVWKAAAPKIREGRLDHVFLECSYRAGRRKEDLFGHLSPEYVVEEMRSLAREVVRANQVMTTNVTHSPSTSVSYASASTCGNGGSMVGMLGLFFRRRSSIASASATAAAASCAISDKELVGSLSGITLVIIHCKEPMPPEEVPNDDIRAIISAQIIERLDPLELGVRVIAPMQGTRIVF